MSKPVRRKKPTPKTVEVNLSFRVKETEVKEALAEAVFDQIYNQFRGYGPKPRVKVTVAGKEVV